MEEQQPKKQRIIEDDDRISQLPDNLLGIILSFLTMREAVRTSALSTRWRYQLYSFTWKRMLAFLNSVHHFLLHLNSDLKVEKLKVYFSFCYDEYGSSLDQWIKIAISRGIEELDLGLLEDRFFPCPSFLGFNTLTMLDLMGINLKSDENLHNLLSNCWVLEWLRLYQCENIDHLSIRHPLCRRLKYFNVYDCFNSGVIEINGIDLEKFEYKAYFTINLLFNNVPQLKTLYSDINHWRAGIMPVRLPTFPNLKNLSIIEIAIFKRELLWIATLLKASPSLQILELHNCEEPRENRKPHMFPHDHLKEVVITGMRGYLSEIEIAIYLLNNAMTLDRMEIDPRQRLRSYSKQIMREFMRNTDTHVMTRAKTRPWLKPKLAIRTQDSVE
ncbi:hypothetical protein L1049_011326 [Liquidambar formosana]|uniref:F-box domain-containing protein n=1 Tax=Liquidambar formosana TaxID=63359 RepID=A0AAP0RWI1_LIQFO